MKILVVILLVLFNSSLHANEERKIIVGYDEYCPWSCNINGKEYGFAFDLLEVIYPREKLDYKRSSLARALKDIVKGRIDIVPAVFNIGEQMIYSDVLSISRTMAVHRKSEPFTNKTGDPLYPLRLGAVQDYVYSDKVNAYYKAHPEKLTTIASENPHQKLFNMIAINRLDIFIDVSEVQKFWLHDLKLEDKLSLTYIPEDLSTNYEMLFAFTNSDRGIKIRDAFNLALARLEKSGKLQALRKKHYIPPPPKQR